MEIAEKAYNEIVDLFARGSSSNEILTFRPSEHAQERARYLLARNRSGELTADEVAELHQLGELEHLMQVVKARARVYAEAKS